MKKYYLLLFIIAFSANTYCQTDKYKCTIKSTYTLAERLNNYPFNVAKKIMLAAFNDTFNYIPFSNDTVCLSKLTERKIIDKAQIDSLTYILYNVEVKGNTFKYTSVYCYSPKNAIVFLNAQGIGFEFMEFDYECHKARYSSNRIISGRFCNDKFQMLKTFFAKNGIKRGTE